MDLNVFVVGDDFPMIESPTIGLPMLWIEEETKNMTEDEFWEWIVDLNNNWYNETHKESLKKRAEINPNLVPADFDGTLMICLSMIFLQSQPEWKKRGLNPIPR
jgi:hypothetical protein